MVQLGELMMILELHRQGLSVTAIARRTGRDPKTVRKYIERGIEAPAYGPRQVGPPQQARAVLDFLRERVVAFPDLSAARLTREIRERGYAGAYTAVKRFVAAIRPENGPKPFEVRFETPPGHQAQVDFARFVVNFTDEPGTDADRLAVRAGARPLALHLRALRHAPGSADAAALSHPGLRGDRRRADRDPLRPHEDGGDRRGRRRPHRLQPLAARAGAALRLPAARLPPLSGQNQGQSRAAVQLHPPGLLPRPAASATSTISTPSSTTGSIPSPMSAFTAPPSGSSPRLSRPSSPSCRRCPQRRSMRCSKLERRVSHDGLVSIGGNYYSVPDRTRRVVEVQQLPDLIRILDHGTIVAEHPVLEGRQAVPHRSPATAPAAAAQAQRHWTRRTAITIGRTGDHVAARSLAFYQAIGDQLANAEDRS